MREQDAAVEGASHGGLGSHPEHPMASAGAAHRAGLGIQGWPAPGWTEMGVRTFFGAPGISLIIWMLCARRTVDNTPPALQSLRNYRKTMVVFAFSPFPARCLCLPSLTQTLPDSPVPLPTPFLKLNAQNQKWPTTCF